MELIVEESFCHRVHGRDVRLIYDRLQLGAARQFHPSWNQTGDRSTTAIAINAVWQEARGKTREAQGRREGRGDVRLPV